MRWPKRQRQTPTRKMSLRLYGPPYRRGSDAPIRQMSGRPFQPTGENGGKWLIYWWAVTGSNCGPLPCEGVGRPAQRLETMPCVAACRMLRSGAAQGSQGNPAEIRQDQNSDMISPEQSSRPPENISSSDMTRALPAKQPTSTAQKLSHIEQ